MDPDSTAGASDCLSISSNKYNNTDEDYITKLLGFDDNCPAELPPASGVDKTMPDDAMKISNDQVTNEGASELKIMNGHSHPAIDDSFDENDEHIHNNIVDNGFSLARKFKELMQMKKEANDLREKWEQTERERNELQLQVELLQAENLQFKHLKNQREENGQKLNELQKDLASKLKAQLKLRNEIETCNLQISEKNDAIKKMKRDNKSLWNMVTRFARKLADADLLTAKEKNIMKKYGEENHIVVDTFDSEDQNEEKDQTPALSKDVMDIDNNRNTASVENKNRTIESDNCLATDKKQCDDRNPKVLNDGFQFSKSSVSLLNPKHSSGANYFMKSCRDVIEDPHVSDDCLDVTFSELKELRRQLSASTDHFSPISPLPPTPPPTSNKFRHGLSRRNLTNNTILSVPVCKNPNQTPLASKSQGSRSAHSAMPNSSRKLTFCHQQSEGFEAPAESNIQRFMSDTGGDSSHNDANAMSRRNFLPVPYKFSAKRYHDGSVKLNFHINNPITLTVDPSNWEVSCILGQPDTEIAHTPVALQPQTEATNMQVSEEFNNSLESSENCEPERKKISKVVLASPNELTTPVLKSSEQSSFVSVGKSNTLNHDISADNNLLDCRSKQTTFQKDLPLHHPQINLNDNKVLESFSNLHGGNVSQQHFENPADDSRSVVSSSCESPSPCRKKNKLSSQEFLSPTHNLTLVVSEVKHKNLNDLSNVSQMSSVPGPEVNTHLKYDSSGSESELAEKSNLTKRLLSKGAPVKKRRKSNLMASVESSNIIPPRNKGRTLLSRSFSSGKNIVNAETNLEVKKSESSNEENKTATTDQLNNENYLSENSIDPSNIKKLPEQLVEANENAGGAMEPIDTLYENAKGKKRISRIESKKFQTTSISQLSKAKQQNDSYAGLSPKKKAKRERKMELKKMAALKNRAADWAAQRIKVDTEEKVLVADTEPVDDLEIKKLESSNDEIKTSSTDQHNSNCIKLTGQCVDENVNAGESMLKPDTLYENVNITKRVSRIETRNSKTNSIDSPTKIKQQDEIVFDISPKKKAKGERKVALEKMAAIKVKCDMNEKEVVTFEEPIDSTSNKALGCLETSDVKKSVDDDFLRTERQHEKIPEVEPIEQDNFTNDSANIPVGSSAKIQKKADSGNIFNDTFSNVPSSDHSLHKKIEEKSNSVVSDCRDGTFSENDQLGLLCNISKVDNMSNDSDPALASSKCTISDNSNLSKSQIIQQKINTNISDTDKIENVEDDKIQSSVIHVVSTPVKTNYLPRNKVLSSPKSGRSDSLNSPSSISSLPQKSPKTSIKIISFETSPLKVKSPSKSSTKAKSSDGDGFTNINNSDQSEGVSDKSLPPLPFDPFGVSGGKQNAYSNKKTCSDEKLVESSKNGSITNQINNAKTNLDTLFNQEELGTESFIDLLVKNDFEDSVTKTTSDDHIRENIDSNAEETIANSITEAVVSKMEETQASGTVSGDKFVSSGYSNVDMIIDSVVRDDMTEVKESQVSNQTVAGHKALAGPSTAEPMSNTYSNIDMIIDSVAVGGIEIEVETQDPPYRASRKRQSSIEDNLQTVDKKKSKGGLKSINLSIAKESALINNDTSHISGQISEADSDNESPLIIAEDFEEVQQSNGIPEIGPLKEILEDKVKTNTLNKGQSNKKQKTGTKTPKKIENKTELPNIDAAFQVIDKVRFTETHFKLHVHNLLTVLINPSVAENTNLLVFHLIKYLHTTRKNPMLSFFLSNDPDTLLPMSEMCIVQALVAVEAKNKPHLSGLLICIVKTIHELVLGKAQYHIYGLSALCRVFAAICKEQKDPYKPRHLCCEVLKYCHKFAPFLVASIVGVYREAFEVLPNTTEEEKIFLGALSYGVQRKPKTLTETQWKHCSAVFTKYLTVEFLANVSETLPYIMGVIDDKCLTAHYENEFMLTGPMVIYARVNGWDWAREHLLEDYVLVNLDSYCGDDDEKAFSFFSDLCAEICYGCPNKELARSYLMKIWRLTGENEFVQVHAGAALLKLVLLRKELFPDEMQDWIPHYHEDPRLVEFSNIYFRRRLMEDHDLDLQNDIGF